MALWQGRNFDSINPQWKSRALCYAATAQDVDDAVRGGGRAQDSSGWRDMPAHNVLCCSIDLPT